MNNLFYNNPDYKIGNDKYFLYMCEGQRGRGKTSWWLNQGVDNFFKTGWKFVFLRRSEKEMELCLEKGLFNGCANVPEYAKFWETHKGYVNKGRIYIEDTTNGKKYEVGYICTLNNVKGISVEDCNFIIFDEYVAIKRSKYKGGENGLHEPELFLRLLETLFRRRKFWCVLLGNNDTPSNPYNECWKIPFGCKHYKDKSRGLWYEFDYSEETAEHKANTVIGIISKGTPYSDYSLKCRSLSDIDSSLIADKTKHSTQIYNVKAFGELLTIWKDDKNTVLYLTSKCAYNPSCATMCVTNADMTINTDFIKYDNVFTYVMKTYYGAGKMRFDSQKTAGLFATILALK